MELHRSMHVVGLLVIVGIFSQALVSGLRDVRVNVPHAIRRSERAILKCFYDTEGDSLYSVKWYKGRREFYRYTPKENPAMKIFHTNGIKIDTHYSNESQLTLLNVQSNTSGKYSCEVSAEAPSFHTLIAAGEMEVVEPPNHNPLISGIRPRYKVGEIVRGNCTSRHSRPAANLTWTINNQEANPSHVRHHRPFRDTRNDMETAISGIHFVVTPQHFLHGKLKVRCTAFIHDVYLKSTEKSIEEERHKQHSSTGGNSINLIQTLPYDQYALQDADLIDKKDTYLTHIQGDVSSLNAGGSGSTALISSAPNFTSVALLLGVVLQLSHFYIHHLCTGSAASASARASTRRRGSKSNSNTTTSSSTSCWQWLHCISGTVTKRRTSASLAISSPFEQSPSTRFSLASSSSSTTTAPALASDSLANSIAFADCMHERDS